MNPAKYGLPPPCEASAEDEQARAERIARVREIVHDFRSAVVSQIGVEEADRIWKEGKPRKHGRPKKMELTVRDKWLLCLFDELANDPNPETRIKHIARFLHKNSRHFRSVQCEGLERQLRRLLRDRNNGKIRTIEHSEGPNDYEYTLSVTDKNSE